MPQFSADILKLEALQGRTGRTSAKAAGLSVFNGPECPMRGHGRVRTMAGSLCVNCIDEAANVKHKAREAGREAALKGARAELARAQRVAERTKLKEEAAALKAQQKADNLKAARATERAKRKAERQAAPTPQAAPVEPVGVFLDLPDEDDDRLPWE